MSSPSTAPARMTPEEYSVEQAKVFEEYKIPPELQSSISYRCYETGHAYGYEECLCHLKALCSELSKPIQELIERVRKESA